MSDYLEHIEEACKIIMSEACNLDLERVKHKNLFKLKGEMYSIILKENEKLKRLLTEACKHLDYDDGYGNELHECSKELQQWYEEHNMREHYEKNHHKLDGSEFLEKSKKREDNK